MDELLQALPSFLGSLAAGAALVTLAWKGFGGPAVRNVAMSANEELKKSIEATEKAIEKATKAIEEAKAAGETAKDAAVAAKDAAVAAKDAAVETKDAAVESKAATSTSEIHTQLGSQGKAIRAIREDTAKILIRLSG